MTESGRNRERYARGTLRVLVAVVAVVALAAACVSTTARKTPRPRSPSASRASAIPTTRYFPITEDAASAQAWTSDTDVNVNPGKARAYRAYFPAPGAGVTAIDVELPHGGPTIHNVPVE